MKDNQPTPQASPDKKAEELSEDNSGQTITIEIVRHRQLFNILRNPVALWKFLGILMVLVVLLFLILATVSLIIKRYYPYNDINTNIYGATTLKNEDKDVTYWLFNTAEMWANSGIKVHENDILTIRTSGAWHTAIHHLVEDSKGDSILRDGWIGSDGALKGSPNDNFRSKFRIEPTETDGMLLMAVFPERSQNVRQTGGGPSPYGYSHGFITALESNNYEIYPIGRERINMRMLSDGILHFAVNDIILTRPNIKEMYRGYIKEMNDSLISKGNKKTILSWVNSWEDEVIMPEDIRKMDIIIDQNRNPSKIQFGSNADSTYHSLLNNELLYYYNRRFYDAWYVDNIGSALIVIEHKHQDQK